MEGMDDSSFISTLRMKQGKKTGDESVLATDKKNTTDLDPTASEISYESE